MDRIIEVKVSGDYISKDNNFAGVCGSGNVTCLRITFDKDWKEYAKKITFWNARGLNPVEITLTTNLLEDTPENTEVTEVYIVTIPAEPLEFSGMLTFVVEGYDAVKDENGNIIGEKRVRCVPCELEVEDAPVAAGLPVDPTPTQAEQLQEQIDEIIDTIRDAVEAKEAIENMSVSAEKLESTEEVFVKKTIQDEVVNLHFGLAKGDSAYDIAVKHGYEGTEEEWNAAVNEARVSAESSAIEAKAWADYAEETVAATAKKDLSNVSEETLQNRVYKIAEATSDDGVHYVATVEGVTEIYDGLTIQITIKTTPTSSVLYLNLNGLGVGNYFMSPKTAVISTGDHNYYDDKYVRPHLNTTYRITFHGDPTSSSWGWWVFEDILKVKVDDLYGYEGNEGYIFTGGEFGRSIVKPLDEVREHIGAASQADLEEVKTSLENNITQAQADIATNETAISALDTRLDTLESNKKVPATYYNEHNSLDRIPVEFTISDTETYESWAEFEQSVYNDPTGVVFNGEHFYGDLTLKYLVQPSSDIESSVITRSQIVTCEGMGDFNPSIYMRRGTSGITVVSQNEDGSYVCTSDNNWINTAWVRVDVGAADARLTEVETSVGDIEIALDNIIAIQNELIGGESV